VLVLDVVKGVVPVVWFAAMLPAGNALPADAVHVLLGIACICGHVWTIFLNFKGGKGIATTLGVIIGLSLKFSGVGVVLVVLLCVWMLVFALSRIVSLSSVISAVCFPLMMAFFQSSRLMTAASFLLSAFVIYKHRANLARLKQGKESRLKF
jgi:glycerol-3-phosphate acyltransferase PlsY